MFYHPSISTATSSFDDGATGRLAFMKDTMSSEDPKPDTVEDAAPAKTEDAAPAEDKTVQDKPEQGKTRQADTSEDKTR